MPAAGTQMVPPDSPRRRRSDSEHELAAKDKLHRFRIFVEENEALPALLSTHCATLKGARATPSPKAGLVAAAAACVIGMGEQDGIDGLVGRLLFDGAADGGRDYVRSTARPHLNPTFLPSARATVAESIAALGQPQPDTAYGYTPTRHAHRSKTPAPFTLEQEDRILACTLTPEVHFPYLTAQWKSSARGGTHDQAIAQAARDGATIVNYLHAFFRIAHGGAAPSEVETCHFSVTVDLRSVYIFVHWRSEQGAYHMEPLESGIMAKERDMREIRTVLRNIEDYALSTRLRTITQALDRLRQSTGPTPIPVNPDAQLSADPLTPASTCYSYPPSSKSPSGDHDPPPSKTLKSDPEEDVWLSIFFPHIWPPKHQRAQPPSSP